MSGPRDAVPATAGFGSGAGSDPGPRHPRKTRAQAGTSGRRPGLPGWGRLRHGGLLLDATRLAALSQHVPDPLADRIERQLRQRAGAISEAGADGGAISSFVAFVLEEVCGLDASTGAWSRGSNVSPSWGRRAITGETVKPRHLWTGPDRARLPVFLDDGRRLGVGGGRRIVSQVLGWLRAGDDHLALVTNGRQWRLLFAGLDYDAWCEWDLDLWLEEGELSPQVTALRTLLNPALWTPESEDAAPPLLQAIRDTRKGQAELSEVLGERVREAVEILIRGHGEALSVLAQGREAADVVAYRAYRASGGLRGVSPAGTSSAEAPSGDNEHHVHRGAALEDRGPSPEAPLGGDNEHHAHRRATLDDHVSAVEIPFDDDDPSPGVTGVTPQDIYRAACRVAMRLVVILFAESRELLPRDNALYHESYGLNGLLERLERAGARGGGLAAGFSAWPRVLALFTLVREGSHHPDLPVTAYGGDLFAPGTPGAADGLSRALFVFENACFDDDMLPDRDVHEMLKRLTRTTVRIRQGRGGTRAVVPVDFSDLSSEYIGILYEGLLDYELKTAPPGDPVIFLSVGDQPALPLSRLEAMEDRALRTLFERLKESASAADAAPDGAAPDDAEAGEPSDESPDPPAEAGGSPRGHAAADLFDETSGWNEASGPNGPSASNGPVEPDGPGGSNEPGEPGGSNGPNGSDESGEPDEPYEDAEAEPLPLEVREPSPEYLVSGTDERRRSRTRAETWARRAAQVAGLVRKPRGRDTPERRREIEARLGAKARQLVARVVLPGEWYLVRWGGTRKGSGSFYTRPGLAVPTVQRTLRPLAYDPPAGPDGTPDPDAPAARWTPKRPEDILALTVCDPACGSGTFPLAALRFLTDALHASLQHHGRIEPDGERALVRLLGLRGGGATGEEAGEADRGPADPARTPAIRRRGDDLPGNAGIPPVPPEGVPAAAPHHEGPGATDARAGAASDLRLADELIPCPPDDERFESRLKAVLRRHVVERCIYAVDLDPLAVELCRLSLWIETMDRTLPFGFLDHKVKCGNALVGAWFDRFRHYPAMAWKNRDGGDRSHANGVHFEKGARTGTIKAFARERLTPDLQHFLRGPDLFEEDLLEKSLTAHEFALNLLVEMHALPVHDAAERTRLYRERLQASPQWRVLRRAMDLWCACWFWPAEEIERAPLPSNLADPPVGTGAVADRLAAEMRFFHWELEFPDVFREAGAGFDAILGNPPWDIAKPVSKEFFSSIDPLYRSYGKQEALRKQREYFAAGPGVERDWLDYSGRFRAQSNFTSHAASPFGDPEENAKSQDRFTVARGRRNRELHDRWRRARARSTGFGDPAHPFRHQGSADLNLYKLFLEAAHALLRPGGRLGFVVPSGLYSDNGTGALRRLFMERCRWEWLFGIENRDKLFPIHRSYKFNPVIVEKGGATEAIRTAFMRRSLDDWERAEAVATAYSRAQVERFSPRSRAILEIQSGRDLEILEKIYADAVLLGDDGPDGWGIRYAREFDMTNDSRLFPPRPQWEAKGYRPDEYSRWLLGEWRPVEELWEALGVDPSRPEPAEIDIEEWLFDATAGPERREAEARLVHGHWLKPGDVVRTDWRLRCAPPPYDRLPVPRGKIPAGVILSREGDSWIREEHVGSMALPVYVGKMIYVGDWAVAPAPRETPGRLDLDPEYLIGAEDLRHDPSSGARVVFRDISNATNERTLVSTLVPGQFPCGNVLPVLERQSHDVAGNLELGTYLSSLTSDWSARQRMAGTHLNWHVVEPLALPSPASMPAACREHVAGLLLYGLQFAGEWIRLEGATVAAADSAGSTTFGSGHRSVGSLDLDVASWSDAQPLRSPDMQRRQRPQLHPCSPAERLRLRVQTDAIATALFGVSPPDLRHILADCDYPRTDPGRQPPKGFWRIDRDREPELRHTVLTLIAFHDLESKIQAAGGDRAGGIEAFLAQHHGEGWMLPETLRLADYGLGHDERARHPQPVASRIGPRFHDWQLARSVGESWRECHLHARNLLGVHDYAPLLVELIERRAAADGDGSFDLLTDGFTRTLLGDDGCATVLLELRSRNIVDEDAYWSTLTALRDGGDLDENAYGQLLDKLRAGGLPDDVGYRRRRDGIPLATAGTDEPLLRVAERKADYQVDTRPKSGQSDLFD